MQISLRPQSLVDNAIGPLRGGCLVTIPKTTSDSLSARKADTAMRRRQRPHSRRCNARNNAGLWHVSEVMCGEQVRIQDHEVPRG